MTLQDLDQRAARLEEWERQLEARERQVRGRKDDQGDEPNGNDPDNENDEDETDEEKRRRKNGDTDDEDDEALLARMRTPGFRPKNTREAARAICLSASVARGEIRRDTGFIAGPPQRSRAELTEEQRAASARRMVEIHEQRLGLKR